MEKLDEMVRMYNSEFESRTDRAGITFVNPDQRPEYLISMSQIRDRVTFYDAQVINIDFISDGKVLSDKTDELPEDQFGEAVVTIRYELVRSPSASLHKKIIKQKWKVVNGGWFVFPDLDAYLK